MSKLLIDERPLTVLPSLVGVVGMERAVILQQIHWLLQIPNSGVEHEGEHWVWGSYEEWCKDYFPFWEPDTLRKHIVKLEREGFLFSAQIKGFDRRKAYRINHQKISEVEPAKRHDHAGSKRKNVRHANRHDHATSMRDDHATSKRDDDAASKRDDHASCLYTETSTKTSTETTTEGEIAADAAPALPPWPEFLAAFCWVCFGHKEVDALTEKQKGILLSEAKRLRGDGYTVDDLRDWFIDVWQKDWRWTHKDKRERPTPADVRSMIPAIRDTEQPATNGKYSVDLPGIVPLQPPAQPAPSRLPAAMPHDDPWAIALAELTPTLPGVASSYLVDSRMEAAGDVNGIPLYRIVIAGRVAVGVQWLTHQAGPAIRRKLGSVLGKPVLIEIVAAEAQAEEAL